jgi:hypothetical protein
VTITPIDNGDTYLGADPGLERLYDNVQVEAPGLTLPVAKMALWNTIEDFALRSTYFRSVGYGWAMPANVNT